MDISLSSASVTASLFQATFGIEPPDSLEEALADGSATLDDLTKAVLDDRGRGFAHQRGPRSADSVQAQQRDFSLTVEATHFHARVFQAEISDGRITLTEAEVEFTSVRVEAGVKQQDPLVLDLDGDGIETTGVSGGVAFDIDGDGDLDQTSTVTGGDAFLALDRNGDGIIADGTELIGDHHGAADGIAELSRHDDNGDGVISRADSVWSSLGLFRPGGVLTSLDDAGITAIDLARIAYQGTSSGGDTLVDALSVHRSDGTTARAVDAWLSFED